MADFDTYLCSVMPVSLISSLCCGIFTTGPLLDRLAPPDKKSFAQGFNSAIYDFTNGTAPIVLGWISDQYGSTIALWVCVGFSVLAVLAGLPMLFHPRLSKPITEKDDDETISIDEAEVQSRLENGDYVFIEDQYKVNRLRGDNGQPFLKAQVGKYDHNRLAEFSQMSKKDLKFLSQMCEMRLASIHNIPEAKKAYVSGHRANRPNEESIAAMKKEIGEWLTDYLHCNGYLLGLENPQILKSIFIKSFPTIVEETELTEENVEQVLIKLSRIFNDYAEAHEAKKSGLLKKLKRN